MVEQRGRIPIGGRTSAFLAVSTVQELRVVADRFGQRRFGAIVRIALRRLVSAPPDDLVERLAARRGWSTEQPPTPLWLGPDLRAELDVLAGASDGVVSELIRFGCDALLLELATARLNGAEIDLTDAVHEEMFRGSDPNRAELIRRRERKEARRRSEERSRRSRAK